MSQIRTALVGVDRRTFIGGSDARIIMGSDEKALQRLWREKRGEVEPEDLSGNLIVQLGLATEALKEQLKTVRVAPVEGQNLDDATNYGRALKKAGEATDEEIQAARDLVRANMKRDIIGVVVDKMTPEVLNDQLREISPKLSGAAS